MNADVDLFECVKLVLDAVDQLAAHAVRTTGTLEAQRAEQKVARARQALDAVASAAIAQAG